MKDKRFGNLHCRLMALLLVLCLPSLVWAQQAKREVRVLSIGNSFSRDAFCYVPFIMENLAPDVKIDWGIMYIGGCSLERHWQNFEKGSPSYQFDRFVTGDTCWQLRKEVTLQQALAESPWDIVIFQQQSARSRYYDTYQPYLDNLLAEVKKALPNATPAWLLTQAYGEGHEKLAGMSSDEMWARINVTAQRVMDETATRMLIPAGTAVQNARYTVLDRFGKTGHLVYDGYHLHEGIAVYLEGLCAAHVILKHYGVDADIEKCTLRITPQWWEARRIPDPQGRPEPATEEDYAIAARCAKWALENPWQLTVIEK